eukprot:jgi/Phyca11/567786/estExt2_Genewise1.C_PHYCAscaffold_260328
MVENCWSSGSNPARVQSIDAAFVRGVSSVQLRIGLVGVTCEYSVLERQVLASCAAAHARDQFLGGDRRYLDGFVGLRACVLRPILQLKCRVYRQLWRRVRSFPRLQYEPVRFVHVDPQSHSQSSDCRQ